jgi:hypothetical protein
MGDKKFGSASQDELGYSVIKGLPARESSCLHFDNCIVGLMLLAKAATIRESNLEGWSG